MNFFYLIKIFSAKFGNNYIPPIIDFLMQINLLKLQISEGRQTKHI